jgi:Glycosyl transferase family 2
VKVAVETAVPPDFRRAAKEVRGIGAMSERIDGRRWSADGGVSRPGRPLGASAAWRGSIRAGPGVAGVCVVRDARDIIPFICGHYLRVGLTRLAFIDDGSLDGTFEFLSSLSSRTGRVSVTRVVHDGFEQPRLLNEAANSLIEAGYRIVVPFDADEFWNIRAEELERRYSTERDIAFFGRWINFVQDTEVISPRRFGLFWIRYHAVAMADADSTTVTAFHRPFVCHSDRKVAFKTSRNVELTRGQHLLVTDATADKRELEIFHIPLRYRSEIEKRGLNYEPRRAKTRTNPLDSWQSAFHREVVMTNRVEEVWAANSVSRAGCLESYGERLPLVPDLRLRRLLLKASWYLLCAFGMFVF